MHKKLKNNCFENMDTKPFGCNKKFLTISSIEHCIKCINIRPKVLPLFTSVHMQVPAPLSVTSICGISFLASSDALYIEAPDSSTMLQGEEDSKLTILPFKCVN